ncbi:E3 ubiquitin-protein ligase RNF146 isoform X2 [Chrysemys picta bellii]|uniref:E3 ubiquitin-protein ligase RNF146 isoform X2 n=1 Tax=Chrysemys picta bellii TaxID=8478 RepID=UPI001C666EE0|nr:E3 ubiquitin-protein ligase RNF146 isoform X1 [Chrysemys picta bellii]
MRCSSRNSMPASEREVETLVVFPCAEQKNEPTVEKSTLYSDWIHLKRIILVLWHASAGTILKKKMAGCGEIDHSINMLPTNRKTNESCSNTTPSLTVPECAICLQTCVHPVSLPCKHVFCYLCVKGASWLGKRCALCRQEIPEDFLDKPTLLSPEELKVASRGNGEYAWYYEGRNGWWQYDERTSRELEDAFSKGKKSTEMLIAGFLYVADLENMVQYRRNEHGRRRKIKRDIIDIPKKGVAGLRLDCDSNTVNLGRESSADGADSTSALGAAAAQPLASVSARPLTSLDGQLTSPATPSPDASTSLENSFAHLQINGDDMAERSHRGEGEEDHESSSSGRVPAPDTSVEETESDDSSDSEDVYAQLQQHTSSAQQRHLNANANQSVIERPVAGGGAVSTSVRSRRPDGQCTVTEV